jgi:anti-sigma regulatory factor (Ser/Thr protein kinase)
VDEQAAFPAELASAPAARRFATSVLRSWRCDELVDAAQLLLSELVVNAVLHAESSVTVTLELLAGRVRIEVADRSAVTPQIRPVDPAAVSGRGLMIVDALASAWGVDPTSDGKVVWFELAVDDIDASDRPTMDAAR